jgi:hypothetical protein
VRREVEEEKHHQMVLIEKKCREDIEGMKQEERNKHAQEMKKLTEVFLLREKETTEDLMSLEELHASHIEKLVSDSLSPFLSSVLCPLFSYLVNRDKRSISIRCSCIICLMIINKSEQL